MSEITNDPRLKQAAEEAIAKAVDRRVISFTLDGETYWIKRKMGNGRKQFVKYSVEKEFYFEVAKMTIAGRAAPLLVPEILVLTPDYMVTKDGGRTLKNWLDTDMPEEDKEQLLEEAGRALCSLHQAGIVHGLRHCVTSHGKREISPFWTGRTACLPKTSKSRRPSTSFSSSMVWRAKTTEKKDIAWKPWTGAIWRRAERRRAKMRSVSSESTASFTASSRRSPPSTWSMSKRLERCASTF